MSVRKEKSCSKCRLVKPLGEFYFSKSGGIFYPACTKCHSALANACNKARRARKRAEREAQGRSMVERMRELVKMDLENAS